MRRGPAARGLRLLALLSLACGTRAPHPPRVAPWPASAAQVRRSELEIFVFRQEAASPLRLERVTEALSPLYARCQLGDAALARVAERLALRRSEGRETLDVSEIGFALRAEGSPYVWPRAWTLESVEVDDPAAAARLQSWLDHFNDGGQRRCGIAFVEGAGRPVLAAVAVDAMADLAPVPLRPRAGSWVDVDARMLVATSGAQFMVLGPSGAPYSVPTSFDGQRARARFRADRPGAFLVQLLAEVAGGPRPVLETTLYAEVEPPQSFSSAPAPGEPRAAAADNTARALLAMLNAARASEGLSQLERDPLLDAAAQKHAEAMRALGRVAHDAGDGSPRARIAEVHPSALETGENVAHSVDVRQAHRALWASPSHRGNLLQPRFDRVGIGVASDLDGSVWVSELFADLPDPDVGAR